MAEHSVIQILEKWNSRREVLEDVRRVDPDIEMIAVHRWYQRKSIPASRWPALIRGAKRRKIKLTLDELAEAHAAPVAREDAA